jgi:hypothetical protein
VPIVRNTLDPSRFNAQATLPFSLRLEDFRLAVQDVYDFFFDVNTSLALKGLVSCPADNWHCDGSQRGWNKARERVDTAWYRPVCATPCRPRFEPPRSGPKAPAHWMGFDQMAPSRSPATGSIPLGIDPVARTHDHRHLIESQCQLSAGQDT